MSQITKPIILDETGQSIATAISSLANRANDIENFTSSDVADGSATAWTSVTPLASGEVHSSIFAKVSQMFKNIRYLYKMLGTTNISSIGGGTVTGAVSALNSKLGNVVIKTVSTYSSVNITPSTGRHVYFILGTPIYVGQAKTEGIIISYNSQDSGYIDSTNLCTDQRTVTLSEGKILVPIGSYGGTAIIITDDVNVTLS